MEKICTLGDPCDGGDGEQMHIQWPFVLGFQAAPS